MGNVQWNIPKYPGIVGDNLSDLSISSGDSLGKLAIFIGQNNRQPIQLPGQQYLMISGKCRQFSHILGLIKWKHRWRMAFFGEFIHRFISYCHGGASRQYRAGLFL